MSHGVDEQLTFFTTALHRKAENQIFLTWRNCKALKKNSIEEYLERFQQNSWLFAQSLKSKIHQ